MGALRRLTHILDPSRRIKYPVSIPMLRNILSHGLGFCERMEPYLQVEVFPAWKDDLKLVLQLFAIEIALFIMMLD